MPIVEGVGAIVIGRGDQALHRRQEEAMGRAVMECLARDITDPDAQRDMMLAYKDVIKRGGTLEDCQRLWDL